MRSQDSKTSLLSRHAAAIFVARIRRTSIRSHGIRRHGEVSPRTLATSDQVWHFIGYSLPLSDQEIYRPRYQTKTPSLRPSAWRPHIHSIALVHLCDSAVASIKHYSAKGFGPHYLGHTFHPHTLCAQTTRRHSKSKTYTPCLAQSSRPPK